MPVVEKPARSALADYPPRTPFLDRLPHLCQKKAEVGRRGELGALTTFLVAAESPGSPTSHTAKSPLGDLASSWKSSELLGSRFSWLAGGISLETTSGPEHPFGVALHPPRPSPAPLRAHSVWLGCQISLGAQWLRLRPPFLDLRHACSPCHAARHFPFHPIRQNRPTFLQSLCHRWLRIPNMSWKAWGIGSAARLARIWEMNE